MSRKELDYRDLTAVIDTRDQKLIDLSPLKVERGTLPTGDITIKGLEHVIAVERKGLEDIVACCGRERERFDREVHRLLSYPSRLVVIEAQMSQILLKQFRGSMEPNQVMGAILGWTALGLPFLFAGSHEESGKLISRFLFIAARRRWREAQSLCSSLKLAT